jgi:hypothetical protein
VNAFQKIKVDRAFVAMHYEAAIARIYSSDAEGDAQ